MVATAATNGVEHAFVSIEDAEEAALIEGITVYPTPSLATLIAHLTGEEPITPLRPQTVRAALE